MDILKMKDTVIASKQASKQARLYTLDYLRGICAFGIMIYHYLAFGGFTFDAGHLIQRIGIYGVSAFYVLSGLTLYCVYQNQDFRNWTHTQYFWKKRIARIFPLFILCTLLVFIAGKNTDWLGLLLNITGLFAVLDWSRYFVTGGWSIGNELVFYLIFPIAMLALQKSRSLFVILWLMSLMPYVYFAMYIINADLSVAENWRNYINPLNQVFLFLSGVAIGCFWGNKNIKGIIGFLFILLGLLLFAYYPLSGTSLVLMQSEGRLVFTAITFLMVALVFKWSVILPDCIHKPLALLGEISYAVYLLHAIIFSAIKSLAPNLILHITSSILLTLITSYFSYHYFEQYFMKKVH